jgi:imidazolonepropionase
LDLITDGAVVIREGIIEAVGKTEELLELFPGEIRYDATGRVVMPGFIDPHTHVIWAGDRAVEFELRIAGKSYLEILQGGGGILSTVQATRSATIGGLVENTMPRLKSMLSHGTTTAEVKTGYGLELDAELRMLDALFLLDKRSEIDLVPTFLGAHAIPQEFGNDPEGYTDLMVSEILPTLKEWWIQNASRRPLPFVDVFCETGAFSLQQSRRILSKAAELGFPLKIHADEFDNLGGVGMAVELEAISADHLVSTCVDEISKLGRSETVAVALPCTPFGLAETEYTPAEAFIEADAILAIATDINPGTAWCESIQFAISLACRYMRLTPAQALAAATINAAAAVEKQDVVGSLTPGKQADIIVLDIPDFRHLGYRFGTNLVLDVFKSGKRIRFEESPQLQRKIDS